MSDDDHPRMLLGRGWAITCEDDGRVARLRLPHLELAGVRKPVNIYMDMGAEDVEALLQRLAEIRAQMFPPARRESACADFASRSGGELLPPVAPPPLKSKPVESLART